MPIISLPAAANGLIQVVFDDATPLTAYHVSIMARGGGSLNLDTTSILDLPRQSNAGFVRGGTVRRILRHPSPDLAQTERPFQDRHLSSHW